MSSERFIHSRIWRSESFSALSLGAKLLTIGMISCADDHGRGKASPKSLKLEIFPGDDVELKKIKEWAAEIEKSEIAVFYDAGDRYYYFPNWAKYQKLRYVSSSKIPDPPSVQTCTDPGKSPETSQVGRTTAVDIPSHQVPSDAIRYKDVSSETSSSSGKPEDAIDFDSIVVWWNAIAPLVPAKPIRFLSEQRKQHVRCRLKEHPDALAEIEDRIKTLGAFGRKGWLQFAWIFKSPENLIKLLEGNYDDERLHGRKLAKNAEDLEEKALAEYMRNRPEPRQSENPMPGAEGRRVLQGSRDGSPVADHDGSEQNNGPGSVYGKLETDVPF